MLWAEANVVAPSGNIVAYMVAQLGVVAALVWYLWYVTSREMPKARGDYLAAIERVISSTGTSIDTSRRDYIAALEQQRTSYAGIIQNMDDRYHALEGDVQRNTKATWELADAVRAALDLRRPDRPSPHDVPRSGLPPPAPTKPG